MPLKLPDAVHRHRKILIPAFYGLVLALCALAIGNAFSDEGPDALLAGLAQKQPIVLATALGLVLGVYAVLVVIERFAHADADVKLPFRRVLFSALVGNAIAIGAGLGPVSGGAVRARMFTAWGKNAGAAALVAAVVTTTSLSGGALLAALGLLAEPGPLATALVVPTFVPRLIALLVLVMLGGILVGASFAQGARKLFGIPSQVPGPGGAALRITAGAADWALSASVLYVLLPEETRGPFVAFAAVFAVAHFAGMAVGTPAGLGVFDALMLHIAPTDASAGQLAAALLLYRLLAFFLPLGLALFSLAVFEGRIVIRRRRER
jgi:phosphatidylglycerol lysyltransferase